MKTDHLIHALALDSEIKSPPVKRVLAVAAVPALAIALGLYFSLLGLRPHLIALLGEPRISFKIALCLLLAVLSGPLVLRLARPGAEVRRPALLLFIPVALLAVSIMAEAATVPEVLWGQRLIGSNAAFCLKSIPLLALAPLAGVLIALRHGAPTRPGLAGAVAGLLSGAIGAALYATHCPDDSPFFVATWYTLGVAIVTAVGAIAGWRLLRW